MRQSKLYKSITGSYYLLWIVFFIWAGLVALGYVAYLDLIFETTSALPLVEKTFPTQTCQTNGDSCYMGAVYTRKFSFIWGASVATIPMRLVITLVLYSFVMGSEKSTAFPTLLAIFGLLGLIVEGIAIIAYGLEWKDANKKPDGATDTRYDRNIANSYDYCCMYGNYTAFCPNNLAYASLPPGATSPCYGNWTVDTVELKVNTDFLICAIVSICCFVSLFAFLLLASCGRSRTYRKATFDTGEQILVSQD